MNATLKSRIRALILSGCWDIDGLIKLIEESGKEVCEWKETEIKYSDIKGFNVLTYETGCGKHYNRYPFPLSFKFCPFCGKPIKEVGK